MGAWYSTNQSDQINALLPPEMLHQVFCLLPPRDMKNVLLVCQLWREVGEAPGLWSWVVLRVTRENMANMPEVLGIRRLKTVRKLMAWTVPVELLKGLARHQLLRVMEVGGAILPTADPEVLVTAVTMVEEQNVEQRKFKRQEGEAIFTAICQEPPRAGDSRVQKLELGGNSLSSLEPGLLARVVSQLEEGCPLAGLATQKGAVVCLVWALCAA